MSAGVSSDVAKDPARVGSVEGFGSATRVHTCADDGHLAVYLYRDSVFEPHRNVTIAAMVAMTAPEIPGA